MNAALRRLAAMLGVALIAGGLVPPILGASGRSTKSPRKVISVDRSGESLNVTEDPNEPNNDPGTATPMACESSQSVAIDPLEDVDYYRLTGPPESLVTIDIDAAELGSALDSVVGAFTSGAVLIGESDDDQAPGEPITTDSYLEVFLPADGEMIIAVSAFPDFDYDGIGGASTGDYTVSVSCLFVNDPNEPNDGFGAATPIPCDSSQPVAIEPQEDVDYYRLTGAPDALVTLDVDAAELGSALDSVLGVFDSGFVLIAESDDDPAPLEPVTTDSYLQIIMPADGVLFLAVTSSPDFDYDGIGGLTTGSYTLWVSCLTVNDPNEPNNDFATAAPVACESPQTVAIQPLEDVDYYHLTGPPDSLVTIDVDADELGSALDSILGVFDSGLVLIAESDDDPAPLEPVTTDSYVAVRMPADGELFLAVSSYPDPDYNGIGGFSTGSYVLSVGCLPLADPNEPNDGFGAATSMACPQSVESVSIAPLEDVDYYRLTGPPGASISVDIDAYELGVPLDSLLGVFDSGFVPLGVNDDAGGPGEPLTYDSYLEVTMPGDGVLFIAATAYADLDFDGTGGTSFGPYTLTVSCLSDADPNEPNDGFATATAIACPGSSQGLSLLPLEDVDYFFLTGPPGASVSLDVDAEEVGSTLDPVLGVFDTSFLLTAISDDDEAPGEPPTVDPYLLAVLPEDGALYAAVSAYSDFDFNGSGAESTGPYILSVTCCSSPHALCGIGGLPCAVSPGVPPQAAIFTIENPGAGFVTNVIGVDIEHNGRSLRTAPGATNADKLLSRLSLLGTLPEDALATQLTFADTIFQVDPGEVVGYLATSEAICNGADGPLGPGRGTVDASILPAAVP